MFSVPPESRKAMARDCLLPLLYFRSLPQPAQKGPPSLFNHSMGFSVPRSSEADGEDNADCVPDALQGRGWEQTGVQFVYNQPKAHRPWLDRDCKGVKGRTTLLPLRLCSLFLVLV